MSLKERIKLHEGFRLEPYEDSLGILTVGYGRNLTAAVFTRAEVELMFETDFRRASQGAENFGFYEYLNEGRKGVIVELCYWIGPTRLGKFRKMRDALSQCKWQLAHDELIDSKLYRQIPGRTQELADILLSGEA